MDTTQLLPTISPDETTSTKEQAQTPQQPLPPVLRVVFRDGQGHVHLDWPAHRIQQALGDPKGVVWIDILVRDTDNTEVESLFRDVFGFHPLAIDDALQESHTPKLDDWGNYLYTVFHSLDFQPDTEEIRLHELDIFLGHHYLVTLHSEPMPILTSLSRLLERDGGQRIALGADHLLYHLLDFGVAQYMPAIEYLDDLIDSIQDDVFRHPSTETLQKIMWVKRAAMRFHRVIIPQREVVNRLARDEYSQIDKKDRVYFRDIYDHLVRLHDISETLRDLVAGAMDTYLSALSNRTNQVMKTLTIVTVLFLPLNFLVGFFGMNFFGDNVHLDGLKVSHLYLFMACCLLLVAAPWFFWFWARRRGWF